MIHGHLATFIYRLEIAFLCVSSLSVTEPNGYRPHDHPQAVSRIPYVHHAQPPVKQEASFSVAKPEPIIPMTGELWRYLRRGLNYLEASGEEVSLDFLHPGGVAYGPLALTPIAVKDVQRIYPSLGRYTFDEVLSQKILYEEFAILYADLLLRHYAKLTYAEMREKEVFDVLQKMWFLGPTLYKKGQRVIASRQRRAEEYLASPELSKV